MRKKTHAEYIKEVDALGKGFKVLDRYIDSSTPIRHKCSLGHIWKAKPYHIIGSGSGCRECSHIERGSKLSIIQKGRPSPKMKNQTTYERQVLEIHEGRILVVGEYKGAFAKIKHRCSTCSHLWRAQPTNVINSSKTGCPKCAVGRPYSFKAIRWLKEEARARGIRIRHAGNYGEYVLPELKIRVDGFHRPSNTVFEFHGDCFHGNPYRFKPRSRPHPFSNLTAKELYKRTVQREEEIKSCGYNLIVKWEYDYDAGR